MTHGEKLEAMMEEYRLDAILMGGLKNTLALSQSSFPDEVWYEMMHGLDPSIIVFAPNGKSFAYSSRQVQLENFPIEYRRYELLPETAWVAAAQSFRDAGLDHARIGVDMGHTAAGLVEALREALPDAEFVDAETVFMRLRSVKTPLEIEHTERAVEIAEGCFEDARDVFQENVPIGDVIRAMVHAVTERGGVPHLIHPYELNCSDWRTTEPAVNGLNRNPAKMEPGVTTRLDICINYRGYYSDFKLAVCVGEPSAHALAVVEEHVQRMDYMAEIVRPGKTKREIHDALNKEFKHLDEFSWWLHGVGLDYHEEPRIGYQYPSSPDIRPEIVFEEGNVLALEPSWLVETHTVLEADGPRVLNRLNTRGITVL
jgi:Xaa-Pro aminopeptidase